MCHQYWQYPLHLRGEGGGGGGGRRERERGGRGGGGVSYISHKPLYITTVEPENLASTLIWRFG